jgi:type IV pilus assembly protein PilB
MNRPTHLRAVPPPDAAQPESPQSETPGVYPPSGKNHSGKFLTDVIRGGGLVSPDEIDRAIAEARTAGVPPEQLLLERSLISDEQLARAIAERYGLDFIDLAEFAVDMSAANLLPIDSAHRYQAVPVGFVSEEILLLAMADPANVLAIDDIQMAAGLTCRPAVAVPDDIEGVIGRVNSLQSAVTDAIDGSEGHAEADQLAIAPDEVTDLRASAEDAPVIRLVNSILGQAVTEGASDIHLEPGDGEMRVRFRVDGVLYEAARVPKRMVAGVVSRVKIMSNLDIAEKRVPQDGRTAVTIDHHRIDLRITTLPTQNGEGASIRILDDAKALLSLDQLGVEAEGRGRLSKALENPYGAVLVTGPTGSGKSTTLYAALQLINDEKKNIVTIEDPVEYRLVGVNQINVHPKAGLTFASGLRSVLRADPDVIMLGEVRDAETAQIATEAALTGHLVLTTLHTNDAPGAVARLTEMGIEPFLTASAVDCVVAQRLARKLCTQCKRRTLISKEVLEQQGIRLAADFEAYEAVGCGRCKGHGYRGRIGLFSVMVMTNELKELTVRRESEAELMKLAREQGMMTVREDGLAKARVGLTSVEEVLRVSR